MFEKKEFVHLIQAAAKKIPADLVIKNGRIVNVFTDTITEADLAITNGMIVGIGQYEGKETYDAHQNYLVPGLIDSHMHIESTLMCPEEFSKVSLRHGVTSVIADPHEIGNIKGAAGVQFMIASAKRTPMNIHFTMPSSVPTTPFETNGATIDANLMDKFYKQEPNRVLGLAEVMNFVALANTEPEMIDKLYATLNDKCIIDGHAAGISKDDLNVYLSAGIHTDHEAVSIAEAKERLNRGMYLLMRQGTAAKDLLNLLPVVNEHTLRRCVMVTDDKMAHELDKEGSVDHMIRMAIKEGISPIHAIQMATLNPSECFHLSHLGALGAGYQADFFITSDLYHLPIDVVFHKGTIVAKDNQFVGTIDKAASDYNIDDFDHIDVDPITEASLQLPVHTPEAKIIQIIPNSIVTRKLIEPIKIKDGYFQTDPSKDQLKMAVVNRYKTVDKASVGIVKGFALKEGAIATSIAHDSHNLITVGTNDKDMVIAINHLIKNGGGMVVVNNGIVKAFVPLKIAGLMSVEPVAKLAKEVNDVVSAVHQLGASEDFDQFLTLSFLSLTVIPELKLTDKGLFDVHEFAMTTVEK